MLKLAFRGVLRYKKRTIITAFAISMAILFSICMQTLLTGIQYDSNKNLIWNDTSSAKIYALGYFEDRENLPIDKLISKEQGQQLEKILNENGFINYTKEFISSCQIIFYEDPFSTSGSLYAQLRAIDSNNLNAYNFKDAQIEGNWLSPNVNGIVIGANLAEDINAEINYYVTIQTKGKGGFIQAFDIPIIGIISSGDPVIDSTAIFFDLNTIDDYLELDGSASSYAISYSTNIKKVESLSSQNTQKIASLIKEIDLEAHSWAEIAEDILNLQAADSGFTYIFLFFTFIISIVGISNTMLMSVSERTNEIAMLKTLGYTNKYIRKLFTLEGTIIGIIGIIVGFVLGIIVSLYFQKFGIDISSLISSNESIGYRINSVMHAFISYDEILIILLLGLLVSVLSAYFSVRRTGRGEIAQLFRKL